MAAATARSSRASTTAAAQGASTISCPAISCATTWASSRPTAARIRSTITPRNITASAISRTSSTTQNRLALMLGTSTGIFQIPNQAGLTPGSACCGTPLTVNGQTLIPSENLDENQREVTQFGVLSWQHSTGASTCRLRSTARYSSLTFAPDPLGDLLFNGIAQDAYKQNVAYALQTDARLQARTTRTRCAAGMFRADRSLDQPDDRIGRCLAIDDPGDSD